MRARFYTPTRPPARKPVLGFVRVMAIFSLGLSLSGAARAVDGCTVLLCLAGNWRSIGACVPSVRQALRDLALGRLWPQCGMGGSSGAGNQYVAPEQCPQQYLGWDIDYLDRAIATCPFSGVIQVVVNGQPWSRAWWSMTGESVVEWLPAAKAALANMPGAMDDQFDRDHAAWLLSEQARIVAPPAPPAPPADSGS